MLKSSEERSRVEGRGQEETVERSRDKAGKREKAGKRNKAERRDKAEYTFSY